MLSVGSVINIQILGFSASCMVL